MKTPADKLQTITLRLLDVAGAAHYLSVGVQSIRDWHADGLLEPVPVPGAALREKGGRIVARTGKRRMAKLLFDVCAREMRGRGIQISEDSRAGKARAFSASVVKIGDFFWR
jgi:hypothetical protein